MLKKNKPRAKSAGMQTPTAKRAAVKAQPASAEAKPSPGAQPKNNAAKAVRPTTPTSASPARQAVSEVTSEGLLPLIRSNFDALREQVKSAMEEARGEQAGEAFITALNQLEAGYEELLRGHEDGRRR